MEMIDRARCRIARKRLPRLNLKRPFQDKRDPKVHGILLFRLPGHLDEGVRGIADQLQKDAGLASRKIKVFSGDETLCAMYAGGSHAKCWIIIKIDPRGKKGP